MERSRAAERIELFANTFDLESGRDELADAGRLRDWLAGAGLIGPDVPVDEADHRMCLELRTGVREALARPAAEPSPHHLARADALLAELPVLVSLASGAQGRPVLVPEPGLPPVRRAYALLALDWVELVITGRAARMKSCAEHTCRWIFWDGSKNQSRRWCSMSVCGNRTKARRHTRRARQARTDR